MGISSSKSLGTFVVCFRILVVFSFCLFVCFFPSANLSLMFLVLKHMGFQRMWVDWCTPILVAGVKWPSSSHMSAVVLKVRSCSRCWQCDRIWSSGPKYFLGEDRFSEPQSRPLDLCPFWDHFVSWPKVGYIGVVLPLIIALVYAYCL